MLNDMEELELLRQIANGKELTQNERDFIKQTSEKYNLPFSPKGNCMSCYRDQAILIYNSLQPKEERPKDNRKYHLSKGKQINFAGYILRDENLTDTLVESLIAQGVSESVFEVCE